MATNVFNGDTHVNGSLTVKTLVPSASSVSNSHIAAGANIDADKLVNRQQFTHTQSGTVAAATEYMFVARAAGELVALEACIPDTIATGADRTVTLDLQKSTGAGAFATVLSSTIVFNNGSVLRTLSTGTFSSNTFVDGDIFKLTVAVAGAAGNQAVGLVANLTVDENGL